MSFTAAKKTKKPRGATKAHEKQALMQRIVKALCSTETTGEEVLALAAECDVADMPEQHRQLIAYAAIGKRNVQAAFLHACNELSANPPSIEFLKQHCNPTTVKETAPVETPNPECLTLLAQTMENHEFGYEFDPDIAGVLLQRAIDAGTYLGTISDKKNCKLWPLAVLRATYERVRLVLDNGIDETKDRADWQVAQEQLAHVADDAQLVALGATEDDMLCIHTLRARIAEQGGQSDAALEQYRLALADRCALADTIVTTYTKEFLQARIAILTRDEHEAARLLPAAIEWLDDKGVAANDAEMPELVLRYAELASRGVLQTSLERKSTMVARARALQPMLQTPPPPPPLLATSAATMTTTTTETMTTAPTTATMTVAVTTTAAAPTTNTIRDSSTASDIFRDILVDESIMLPPVTPTSLKRKHELVWAM